MYNINDSKKNDIKIPEPALRRLPWYLAYVKLVKSQGEEYISSTQIAKDLNIDSFQVAKDLSYVQITGKTRVGYEITSMIKVLEDFLGFSTKHKAFLFGVGSLGAALLHDNGLQQYGLNVVAAFDVKYELTGTMINHIPVHHINRFFELRQQTDVNIGILTVPVQTAQEVADLMIKGGIKAIWNFTPFRIKVPENIVVQNTSLYAHLAVMFNRLNELSD